MRTQERLEQKMEKFVRLFQEGKIGKLVLKNRIIFPPMVTRYVSEDGRISEQMLNYYGERSRGGCALVCVEASYPRSGGYPGRIYLDNDDVIPGLRKLVKIIREGGAKAAVQINPHRGRSDELDPASASEAVHPKTGIKVRALSSDDIKKLLTEFGKGVSRAKEAGFDCIMIHGASGYLVSEFLSPRTNRRVDEYGGDVKKRARLALELLKISRQMTGPDYPLIFRLTADEKMERGFGINDAVTVSKLLEEAGADAIDVVSGVSETFYWVVPHMYMPKGCNADLSQAVKKVVRIPVSVAGNINDPYVAEEILSKEKADFVDLGRALIADPQFPNKVKAGELPEICKCLRCTRCIESILSPPVGPMVCSVNPAVGREKEFASRIRYLPKKKRVLVIGGGPGGMKAAILARIRGHDVTLWEKCSRLGGLLNIAAIPPGKSELRSLVEYLFYQIEKVGVSVNLGRRANAQQVLEFCPDVVIIAVGGTPRIPTIKGIEKIRVHSPEDVLSGKANMGSRVIVIGGGYVGCEVADFLASEGKKVTIRTSKSEIADDLFYPYAHLLRQRLEEKSVRIIPEVKEEEIKTGGMEVIDKQGRKFLVEGDDVVICFGSESNKTLYDSLRGKVPEVFEVGDCVKGRRIQEAIYESAEAALSI